MIIMNIINNLFSNDNFVAILTFTFIGLTILFLVILFFAYKDKNKKDKPHINILKDDDKKKNNINNKVKEDVTFEMPIISENLRQYKESIEKNLQDNIRFSEAKPLIQNIKLKTPKQTKVLDIDKIEETYIESSLNLDELNENLGGISNNDNDLLPKKRQ